MKSSIVTHQLSQRVFSLISEHYVIYMQSYIHKSSDYDADDLKYYNDRDNDASDIDHNGSVGLWSLLTMLIDFNAERSVKWTTECWNA